MAINSTALTTRNVGLPEPQDWQTLLSMADAVVKSGLAPESIKTPQAAVVIMLKGRELGIPPLHALNSITVIKGKPSCSAELILALILRDHGDDAAIWTEATAERATLSYKRRSWSTRQSYTFTIEDAKTAELAGVGTWKKYPAALLRSRCASAVGRMAFPDSIGGMYTAEELGGAVEVDDAGEVVVAPAVVVEPSTVQHNGHNVVKATGEIVEAKPTELEKKVAKFEALWAKGIAAPLSLDLVGLLGNVEVRHLPESGVRYWGTRLQYVVSAAESAYNAAQDPAEAATKALEFFNRNAPKAAA